MKNLLLAIALLISSIVYSQKPVLDSIVVYKTIEDSKKGEILPVVAATVYDYEKLYETMSEKADELGVNGFITVFFYKEEENGPQKTMVQNFKRKSN